MEIQTDLIVAAGFVIESVECVLLVATIVEDLILRTVEEASRVQTAGRNKVSPFLLPVGKIEAPGGSAESAVRGRDIPVGRSYSQARASGCHDDEAGFTAKIRRRRAFDDLHRLHGLHRQLIRENLALLVRNWLAVNGEGVRGVIAQPVEKTVGVGRNPWCGERHQRTELRRVALQGQLIEKFPIDVRVGVGIGFDEIPGFGNGYALLGRANHHGEPDINR